MKTTLAGGTFGADRVTPIQLADLLERDCDEAYRLVRGIPTDENASLLYEVGDVRAWALLGQHLAHKLRGAVGLAMYRQKGGEKLKQLAVTDLELALASWKLLALQTEPLYRKMKLTHYNGNSFDANPDNLFRWDLVTKEVERDVATVRAAMPATTCGSRST